MITLLCEGRVESPDEYLVARIRGRREERLLRLHGRQSALLGENTLPDEEAIDRGHAAELRWLCRQMAGRTKRQVAPLLVLFELRRLVNWLRQAVEVGEWEGQVNRYCSESLWHPAILRECAACGAAQDLLVILEKRVAALVPDFAGVSRHYALHNLAAVERRMTEAVLVHGATRGESSLLKALCRSLIDFCNVSGVVKSWLWKLPAPPPAIPAGRIRPERLARIWQEGDVGRVGLPVAVTKDSLTPEQVVVLEEGGKKTIWRMVRQQARMLLDPGAVVVDYLCFLEAEAVHLRGHRLEGL